MPGEGVVIHTIDCDELEHGADDMDDWLDVGWGTHAAEGGPSVARILVRVKNAPGSLAAVMTVIADNGGNIFNLKVDRAAIRCSSNSWSISKCAIVAHLQNILGALRVNAAVELVDRVRDASTSASIEVASLILSVAQDERTE